MWKFFYVLNYLKAFKALNKNNPRTHTRQQNKKKPCWRQLPISKSLVAGTIIYFSLTFVYQKGCFRYKAEKENTTIEFCTFELV